MDDFSARREPQRLLIALAIALTAALLALLREPRAAGLALTTLYVVGGTLAVALPLGTMLAVLLARTNLPLKGMFVAAWCLLLFLPLYVQASAWDAGFGLQGWFTLQSATHGEGVPEPWLSGLRAAIWLHAVAALPWVMLVVGQGVRQVEAELEEVALLDASSVGVLWHVTLPRAWSAILAAGLFITVMTAGEMTITDIYRVRTYAEELYTNAALTTDAVELGLSIWPHMAMIAVLAILAWQAALWLAPIGTTSAPRRIWEFDLGSWRWIAFGGVLLATLLAVGVPVVNLIYKAGLYIDATSGDARQAWSAQRFAVSTLPQQLNPAQWRFAAEYAATLKLGLLAATTTVAFAAPLAWLARSSRGGASLAMLLCAAGLALPGPLAALGLIWLLNRPWPEILPWLYDRTLLAPVLAIVLRTLPLATLVLWSAFRAIEQDQVDAARADGATFTGFLTRILLPQRWPALVVAWLACFALAAGDLTSSILVIPPGQTTIANQIFLLIHAGVHNAEAGLCLGQLALFGALSTAILCCGSLGRSRES